MPIHKPTPINQKDIEEFVQYHSDFGFEIKIKQIISELGFVPLHGGRYDDPMTQKTREYDFRFTYSRKNHYLHAAVECKNVSEFSPLLVSCLPRSINESYLRIFICTETGRIHSKVKENQSYGLIRKFSSLDWENPSRYQVNEDCGKLVNQISRSKDGILSGRDTEVFDKWSQAIASLVAYSQENRHIQSSEYEYELHVFMPLLIVPDNRLWAVVYDETGNIAVPARQVDQVSIFVGKNYKARDSQEHPELKISHIEFMTTSGFQQFIKSLTDENSLLYDLCSEEIVHSQYP